MINNMNNVTLPFKGRAGERSLDLRNKVFFFRYHVLLPVIKSLPDEG